MRHIKRLKNYKKGVKMDIAYLYILSASPKPDYVECPVPAEIDENEIFFGPCKKTLRQKFYEEYLKNNKKGIAKPKDNIYIIGFNASNSKRKRKIVWAGKVKEFMTFEYAWNNLKEQKYEKIRTNIKFSEEYPLHVKPIYENGIFIGYRHINKLHEKNNDWIRDLTSKRKGYSVNGKIIKLNDVSERYEVFNRDCVILLENIFFANGRGIDVDEKILEILKNNQPGKNIDNYAIFGYDNKGNVNGLRGNYLEIKNNVKELIEIIEERKRNIIVKTIKTDNRNFRYKKGCKC